MMKRIFPLLLFLLSLSAKGYSQHITGQVLDESKQPLEFANVVLLSLPDSAFVQGTVSDEKGNFTLTSTGKQEMLRISSIGYVTLYQACKGNDVGLIAMQSDTQILNEVVVKGSLPITRIKGDAMVTNIQNSVLAKAGSANDVLAKVPGIMKKADGYEVFGKGAPLVFINGRQVRDASELEQLNSDNVKEIELITNPGSRYDATVKAVVRIKTVSRQGDGFGFDVRSSYFQSENVDLIEAVNMNYRHKDLDVFGSLRYDYTNTLQNATMDQIAITDTLWSYKTKMHSVGKRQSIRGDVGFNYLLNDNHSLGARYTLIGRPNSSGLSITNNEVFANNTFYDQLENQRSSKTSDDPNHQLNVYYNGTAGELDIDFNADYYGDSYSASTWSKELSQEQENRDVHSVSNVKNRLAAAKLVFSYPLLGGSLSVGGEYTYTHRKDDYLNTENYVPTSFSKIEESSTNAFAEYNRSLPFGELSVGARYEHVVFDYYENEKHIDEQSRNFNNWYPNVSLGTKLGPVRAQLSYTAKTKRPSYRQLSNNVAYLDRYTMQKGNPVLKSEMIHDISLNSTWKFLQLSVSYQQRRDAIFYWIAPASESSSTVIINYINYRSLPKLSAFLSASPKFGLWSPRLSVGIQKQWLSMESQGKTIDMGKPLLIGTWGNSFTFPKDFLLSLDMNYRGKGYVQNTYLEHHSGSVDLSIRKSFLNDAFSLELKGTDLFLTDKEYNLLQCSAVSIYQINTYDTREFSVTFRYKFNASKSKYKGTGAGSREKNRL